MQSGTGVTYKPFNKDDDSIDQDFSYGSLMDQHAEVSVQACEHVGEQEGVKKEN